jgi:hypothetical protein
MVEPRIKLEFENLGMRLANKDKIVLHGVSGESEQNTLNRRTGYFGCKPGGWSDKELLELTAAVIH